MWLPQGGAFKIENSQFTQYSIIMLLSSMLYTSAVMIKLGTGSHTCRIFYVQCVCVCVCV